MADFGFPGSPAFGRVVVAGFAVFGAAARDAHPATSHTVQTAQDDQVAQDDQSNDSFSFGSPSLGDSTKSALLDLMRDVDIEQLRLLLSYFN